jgi:hypothetical protein
MTPDEILTGLQQRDAFPTRAVRAALDHADVMVPRLLELLDAALADPEGVGAERADDCQLYFAMMILGQLRVEAAHDRLLRVFSLPQEKCELLADGLITEYPAPLLWSTAGGATEGIWRLVRDRDAYVYCRYGAMEALLLAVATESVPRSVVVDGLAAELRRELADWSDRADWEWAGMVMSMLLKLRPEELLGELRELFQHDALVDNIWVDEIQLDELPTDEWTPDDMLGDSFAEWYPLDVVQAMSWWAFFRTEDRSSSGRRGAAVASERGRSGMVKPKVDRAARNKKNKAAAKARKKNRKKKR